MANVNAAAQTYFRRRFRRRGVAARPPRNFGVAMESPRAKRLRIELYYEDKRQNAEKHLQVNTISAATASASANPRTD